MFCGSMVMCLGVSGKIWLGFMVNVCKILCISGLFSVGNFFVIMIRWMCVGREIVILFCSVSGCCSVYCVIFSCCNC